MCHPDPNQNLIICVSLIIVKTIQQKIHCFAFRQQQQAKKIQFFIDNFFSLFFFVTELFLF